MAVIRTWSGDGLSPTNLTTSTVGAGDTAFSSINGGGTFTVTADGTRSPQITWPSTSAAHNVRWNALGNLTAWAIRRYFSVASLPGVTWGILVGLNSGGGDLFRVEINSSGYLRYRSATAAVFSPSTNALEAGVVYRIELTGQADGSSTVALYEGDSTTALLSSTVTVTAGNLDEIRFGHHSSMATSGETGDDFAVANTATFIGPVEEDDEPVPEISRKWQGDGLSAGALTTSSVGTDDTAFSSVVGSLTIIASGVRSPRILLPDAAGIKRVHWWPLDSTPLPQYAVRWYQTFGGYSPSEIYLANGLSSGDRWSVRMTASGNLRLRDDAASSTLWTSSTVLPLNKLIRFELVVNGAAISLRAYNGDTETQYTSTTTTLSNSAINELRFGFSSSVASTAVTYDDIAFHSLATEIGPAAVPGVAYTHFRYDGSGWVAQTVTAL